jgi:hypothetical protein
LLLEIGFGVGDLETVFKAQTYPTVLAPKLSSPHTYLAVNCTSFYGLGLLRWRYDAVNLAGVGVCNSRRGQGGFVALQCILNNPLVHEV